MCVIFGESVSKKNMLALSGTRDELCTLSKREYTFFWSLLDKTQAWIIYIIKYTSLEFSSGIALKITQA